MPLIQILIALIVVGVLLRLVNLFIPMAGSIKSILNASWSLSLCCGASTNLDCSSRAPESASNSKRDPMNGRRGDLAARNPGMVLIPSHLRECRFSGLGPQERAEKRTMLETVAKSETRVCTLDSLEARDQ